jgi:hypothetical protein
VLSSPNAPGHRPNRQLIFKIIISGYKMQFRAKNYHKRFKHYPGTYDVFSFKERGNASQTHSRFYPDHSPHWEISGCAKKERIKNYYKQYRTKYINNISFIQLGHRMSKLVVFG